MTAPTGEADATASIALTAARPSCRDAATSGTGSTDIKASLMESLAIRGSRSSAESAGASVDFPLAGGPDTTMKSGSLTDQQSRERRPSLPHGRRAGASERLGQLQHPGTTEQFDRSVTSERRPVPSLNSGAAPI